MHKKGESHTECTCKCLGRLVRKNLWSDGGWNTIIYDNLDHWGISFLPRRSLCRWERRCLVLLRFISHLRLGTNSRSGTKWGLVNVGCGRLTGEPP